MTSILMSICNLSLKSRDVLIWNDCQGLQRFSPENYIFLFTKLYRWDKFWRLKWEHMLLREVISNTREFYNAYWIQNTAGIKSVWMKILLMRKLRKNCYATISEILFMMKYLHFPSIQLHSQKQTICSVTSILLLE